MLKVDNIDVYYENIYVSVYACVIPREVRIIISQKFQAKMKSFFFSSFNFSLA